MVRWIVVITVVVLLVFFVGYLFLRPLPLPCPENGQVVDAKTGSSVPNAVLECTWRLHDYPMLDGAGGYDVKASTKADANGRFRLAVPPHRRGLWNTSPDPPTVKANGYRPFALSDWPKSVRYQAGQVIIMMTPLSSGDGN